MSELQGKLFAALVQAQKNAKAVAKDSKNDHHKYNYASAESLIEEGRTSLSLAGLALLVTNVELVPGGGVDVEDKDTGEVRRRMGAPTIQCTYVLAHESGESITYRREWLVIEQKGRPLDKAQGGALTTSLGYAIRDVLMLPRDDEYADMDRRDDRDHKPANDSKREERRDPPADSDRRPAARDDGPGLAKSGEEWDLLLAAIKKGESITKRLEESPLRKESKVALWLIAQAWAADDEQTFTKVGASIRKNEDLSEPFKQTALREIKPAWDALQDRIKRMKDAS